MVRKDLNRQSLTELKLRDQADIDISASVGGLHGDETCIPAHESHQTDAVIYADGLHVGRANGPDAFCDSSLKAERFVDDGDIVVDGFGDPDDRYLEFALLELLGEGRDSTVRAVSAHHVDVVDAFGKQGLNDFIGVEAPSGTAQNCAALVLQLSYEFLKQLYPVVFARVETHVPVFHSPHLLAPVLKQSCVNLADYHV